LLKALTFVLGEMKTPNDAFGVSSCNKFTPCALPGTWGICSTRRQDKQNEHSVHRLGRNAAGGQGH
ncbi:MAG: hypothetical protein, partial [Olavius algarvensis spirochete endosymbiont]